MTSTAGLKGIGSGLPKSLIALGLKTADQLRPIRRLMIGTDGDTNTGKTEFMLSAPGPNVILPIDASYDGVLDNPYPPAERRLSEAIFDDTIKIPMNYTLQQPNYVEYYKAYRARLYALLNEPDIRTLCIDGDSDTYELQLLAEFGRTTQIHPLQYPSADGPRRAMVKRMWESGKIIIASNKIKDQWEDILDDDGKVILDDKKKPTQRRVPGAYKRQGFRDQKYLWQIQIHHMYRAPELIDLTALKPLDRLKAVREGKTKTEPQWGLRITKCKSNTRLEGDELWGDKCNFKGLVSHIYPQIPLQEWGFK